MVPSDMGLIERLVGKGGSRWALPLVIAFLLVAGFGLHGTGRVDYAAWPWMAGTGIVLAILCIEIVAKLARGEFGLDVIAALAMEGPLFSGRTSPGSSSR